MTDSKPLVLMVQPTRLQGLIWQAVLKSQGLSVIWEAADVDFAENIRQLKLANLALPDLLLVDVALENFNPYAFCRLCRSDYPQMQVLLTHSGRKELVPSERQWAINQGAADFLPGFQLESLVTDVTAAVNRVLEIMGDQPLDNGALISILFSIKRQLDHRRSRPSVLLSTTGAAQSVLNGTNGQNGKTAGNKTSNRSRSTATAMDSSETIAETTPNPPAGALPDPQTTSGVPPSTPPDLNDPDDEPPPTRRYRGVSY